MSLKERLLSKKVLEETIVVDGETFVAVGKGRDVVSAVFAECRNKKGVLNTVKAENKLLALVIHDEHRQPVMDEHEWGRVVPHIARPLVACMSRVCGLDDTDLADPKDSDSTQS